MTSKSNSPTYCLSDICGDLKYEIDMLRLCYTQLKVEADSNWKNVLLESYLIHWRNLIDFFAPEKPHPDDVVARHYLTDDEEAKEVAQCALEDHRITRDELIRC